MKAEVGMRNAEKLQLRDTRCEIQVHDAGFWLLDTNESQQGGPLWPPRSARRPTLLTILDT